MAFLEKTQLDTYNYIQQKGERSFLVRLDRRIQDKGIIEVLRKGLSFNDKRIMFFYPEPNSSYNFKDKAKYDANIFSVTEELIYTDLHKNRLDLTIFLNGLPIITSELKNAFTYQAVQNAIKQYMYDRNPKDKIFNLGRCMVHFAVDTTQVFMAGSLAHKNTAFFPFNKGQNEGKPFAPFGAGRRTCPGQRLAFVEMIIMLSGIINKFEIKLAVDYEEIVKSSDITLGPKLGLPIYCIERESMLQQQYNKDTKEMEWEMKTINSKL